MGPLDGVRSKVRPASSNIVFFASLTRQRPGWRWRQRRPGSKLSATTSRARARSPRAAGRTNALGHTPARPVQHQLPIVLQAANAATVTAKRPPRSAHRAALALLALGAVARAAAAASRCSWAAPSSTACGQRSAQPMRTQLGACGMSGH